MRVASRWGMGSAALVALASFASFGGCGGRTPIDPEDYVLDDGAGGFDLGTGGSSGNQSSAGGTSSKGGSGGSVSAGGSSAGGSSAQGGSGSAGKGGSVSAGGSVGVGGSSAGGAGPGAGGSSAQTCGSCLSGSAPSSPCSAQYSACKGSTSCATLNACLIANDCANGDLKTLKQCAQAHCASFINGGLDKWLAFAQCASCGNDTVCGGSCAPLDLCGQGGTAGAGGAPFSQCDACVGDILSGKGCKKATAECQGVDGCFDFASCLVKTGCVDAGDPIACAEQSGCQKISKKAGKALENLLECAYCKTCDGLCPNVPPGACSGGVGGGTAGTGGTGTAGTGGTGTAGMGGGTGDEQACIDCQNGAFNTCKDTYFACTADPPCNDILNCLQGCGEDPMCGSKCWSDNPQGQPKYYDLYYCYNCVACPSQCGPLVGGACNSPSPLARGLLPRGTATSGKQARWPGW